MTSAHGLFENGFREALFLRAERKADGERTFRMIEGEPLETSYGEDLYRQVFDTQRVTQTGESRDGVFNSAAAEPARKAG
jgi:hypothetical protein